MEDTLVVGSSFDPSGITRGLDIGAASLAQFEKQVRQTAQAFPTLDISKIAQASAEQVRKEAQVVADLNAKVKQAAGMVGNLGAQTKALNGHFEAGRQGGRRLETALTGVALAGAGVTGVTGRLIEGLVTFGAAKVELLETAAAIAVVVAAYELFTKSMHDADAARAKLVTALKTRIEANLSPTAKVGHEVAATEEDRALLERTKTQVTLWKDIGRIRLTQGKLDRDLAEETRRIQEGILLLVQQRVNAEIAVLAFQKSAQAARVTDLGAAAGLGVDNAASLRERAAEMRRLADLIHNEHTSLRERNDAQQQYNTLLDATLIRSEKAFALVQRNAAVSLAAFQHPARLGLAGEIIQAATGTGAIQATADSLGAAADKAEALRRGLDAASPAALRLAATSQQLRDLQQTMQDIVAAATQIPGQNDAFVALLRKQTIGLTGTGGGTLAVKLGADIERGMANAEAGLGSVNVAFDDLDRHLIQTNEFWRKATKEITDHRTAAEKDADALLHFGDAIGALANVGQQLGFLDQDALDALGSVQQLADALASLKVNPGSFAGILGVVSAGLGIAGSLFGKSPLEKEHDQILKENNQRLAELRVSFDSALQGIAGARTAQSVLQTQNIFSRGRAGGHGGGISLDPSAELNTALAQAGLSLREFATIVQQQTGIQILDKEGHIVAASWEQARKAIDENIAATEAATAAARAAEEAQRRNTAALEAAAAAAQHITEVADAMRAAQPTILALRDQLLGLSGDPIAAFKRALAVLTTQIGDPAIAAQFQGIDLNDPAAREALRQKLLDFTSQIISGQISPQTIGVDAFQVLIDFLGQSANALDEFNKALKALSNVPQGLNLTMLEFQAQRAGMGLPAAKPVNLPLVDFPSGGTGARAMGSDGASLAPITWTGNIVIEGAGKNAEEIAAAVDQVIRRRNMSKVGNPDGRRR